MPTLTITLAQSIVDRILPTFPPGTTVSDVEDWIKQQLKSKVQTFESNEASNTTHDSVRNEVW